jgi:hypothetical protein
MPLSTSKRGCHELQPYFVLQPAEFHLQRQLPGTHALQLKLAPSPAKSR